MRNHYEIRKATVYIELRRRGKSPLFAIIDCEDLPKVLAFDCRWAAQHSPDSNTFYAYAVLGSKEQKRTKVYLHRFLLDAPPHSEVDHRNHKGLDNRRCNIKITNRAENQQNRRGPRKSSLSGIPGVAWESKSGKWRAKVMRHGRIYKFGLFETKESAAAALAMGLENIQVAGTSSTIN